MAYSVRGGRLQRRSRQGEIWFVGGKPLSRCLNGLQLGEIRRLFRARAAARQVRPLTKTEQIRACGNSVCPPIAAALIRANYECLEVTRTGVPEFALTAAE